MEYQDLVNSIAQQTMDDYKKQYPQEVEDAEMVVNSLESLSPFNKKAVFIRLVEQNINKAKADEKKWVEEQNA